MVVGSSAYFNNVHGFATFDNGKGGGPALFVGGNFASGVTNRIAKWDGESWTHEGTGVGGGVATLKVFDDGSGAGSALYAGGSFKSPGGVVATDFLAKWDGSGWSDVGGGVDGAVFALEVFDDGGGPALYAGGGFTNAGGTPAKYIAKWDGSQWSSLGYGVNSSVSALAVFDDGGGPALYAGGSFTNAAGVLTNYIAKWDGAKWFGLEEGMTGFGWVSALAVFDDGTGGGPALIAGGRFLNAGGVPATDNIAKWDGSNWSPLGSGSIGLVFALTVFDAGTGGGPVLYAGGSFTSVGGVAAHNIAKWDGSSWSPLGSGMRGGLVIGADHVYALTVFDAGTGGGPALFAGGEFTLAGGVPAKRIAKWDGANWSALGSGVSGGYSPRVLALTAFDDGSGGGSALFVAGDFTMSPSGDGYLAKWGCPTPPTTTFCTAKTTLVCGAASIQANGTASATATSGFLVSAQPVRGCRAGLLLYSDQPVQPGATFGGPGNGQLCLLSTALRRAGPIDSGGTNPFTCDGVMAIDMNEFHTLNWVATGCSPAPGQNNPAGFLGSLGTNVNAQIWGRDSTTTGQVLSDGIRWVIGP